MTSLHRWILILALPWLLSGCSKLSAAACAPRLTLMCASTRLDDGWHGSSREDEIELGRTVEAGLAKAHPRLCNRKARLAMDQARTEIPKALILLSDDSTQAYAEFARKRRNYRTQAQTDIRLARHSLHTAVYDLCRALN